MKICCPVINVLFIRKMYLDPLYDIKQLCRNISCPSTTTPKSNKEIRILLSILPAIKSF